MTINPDYDPRIHLNGTVANNDGQVRDDRNYHGKASHKPYEFKSSTYKACSSSGTIAVGSILPPCDASGRRIRTADITDRL